MNTTTTAPPTDPPDRGPDPPAARLAIDVAVENAIDWMLDLAVERCASLDEHERVETVRRTVRARLAGEASALLAASDVELALGLFFEAWPRGRASAPHLAELIAALDQRAMPPVGRAPPVPSDIPDLDHGDEPAEPLALAA